VVVALILLWFGPVGKSCNGTAIIKGLPSTEQLREALNQAFGRMIEVQRKEPRSP